MLIDYWFFDYQISFLFSKNLLSFPKLHYATTPSLQDAMLSRFNTRSIVTGGWTDYDTYTMQFISLLKMINSDINYMNLRFVVGAVNSIE